MRLLGFGNAQFVVVGDAALYWPKHRALIVADLHLEKASSYALHGQMLPPYDSLATLQALAELAQDNGAKAVICLGDNFHDTAGEDRLEGEPAQQLRDLTTRYDWTWITGNHDPAVAATWGGNVAIEYSIDGIMLRHQAEPGWNGAEISGHFHPKLRLKIRGRNVARRTFVMSEDKIIMPAFGVLTGGMDAADPVIAHAMANKPADALVPVRDRLTRFALRGAALTK
jgi:uncharacterized protein